MIGVHAGEDEYDNCNFATGINRKLMSWIMMRFENKIRIHQSEQLQNIQFKNKSELYISSLKELEALTKC